MTDGKVAVDDETYARDSHPTAKYHLARYDGVASHFKKDAPISMKII